MTIEQCCIVITIAAATLCVSCVVKLSQVTVPSMLHMVSFVSLPISQRVVPHSLLTFTVLYKKERNKQTQVFIATH
jgi:hypothetical protein